MLKLLILLFFLFITSNAWAAQWVEVSRANDGSITYIDKSSLSKQGGLVYFWRKDLFKNIKKIPGQDQFIKGRRVSYMKAYSFINCEEGLIGSNLEWTAYGVQDEVLSTGKNWSQTSMAVPGTVGELQVNTICKSWGFGSYKTSKNLVDDPYKHYGFNEYKSTVVPSTPSSIYNTAEECASHAYTADGVINCYALFEK